jgi:lipoprotein
MNLLAKLGAACATLLSVFATYSCDSIFHDDLSDCPQGVYVRFYEQMPCLKKQTAVGKVQNLHLLAFDKQTGLLANYVAADHEVMLTPDYEILLPLRQGDYDVMAWTGNSAELASAKLQRGVTKKSDFFFQLRQQQDGSLVFPDTPEKLRYGFAGSGLQRLPADSAEYAHFYNTSQYPIDEVVSIPDAAKEGSVFRHAAVNLRQQALRVNVHVIVDGNVKRSKYPTNPTNFALQLNTAARELSNEAATDGAQTSIDFEIPQAKVVSSTKRFPLLPVHNEIAGDSLKYRYNLLGNTTSNLSDGNLVLMHKGKAVELSTGVQERTKSLNLPALIRIALENKGNNIRCGGEVTIELRVGNKCDGCDTYMIYDVVIGPWSVHSYELELM